MADVPMSMCDNLRRISPLFVFQLQVLIIIRLQLYIQMNISPAKNTQSLYYEDHPDTFPNKYLADPLYPTHHHFGGELMKEQLQAEIQSINHTLASILPDKVKLGDLFSTHLTEIQKTLDVIRTLLNQRQRDMQTKNDIFANTRKSQNQKGQLLLQVQKMQKQNKKLQTQKETVAIKLKNNEKAYKQSIEKLSQQRQELSKKYKNIEARQNQYKNENRKLQTTIKTLQDKINKGQEKVAFKNSFEQIQPLQNYGPTIIMMNAEHQYNQIVVKTMEDNYLEVTKENQYYKDTLQGMQKQLQSVLEIKRQILRKRRGYDSEYDSNFQVKSFKGQLINLPLQFNRDGLNILSDNVCKFRQAMKLGQNLDDKEYDQKINCVSNVKNLIKNYKNIVQSQDQLLNKVILKAKEFKSNEMQSIENRYSKGLDEDEVERAKRFLQEQSNYLDSKNRELELTRKAMQNTIKKVQQQRQQFSRRCSQANDQLGKIKKQVQMLPVLIEQELNSY